jgi:hypothetical protein
VPDLASFADFGPFIDDRAVMGEIKRARHRSPALEKAPLSTGAIRVASSPPDRAMRR